MHTSLVKASIILLCENNDNYTVQALYGEIPHKKQLYTNEFLIIRADTAEIIKNQLLGQTLKYTTIDEKQQIQHVSRFNQNQPILNKYLLMVLHAIFLEIKNDQGVGFESELIVTMQNELKIKSLKFIAPKIHAYYTHGPSLSIKKKIIQARIPHANHGAKHSKLARKVRSNDFSEEFTTPRNKHSLLIEHHLNKTQSTGISFVEPRHIMRNLLAISEDGRSFEERLITYITKTLKIDTHTPLMYQSLATVQSATQRDYTFFERELRAIYQLQHTYRYQHIILLLPLIRSTKEVAFIKKCIHKAGLTRSPRFKIYISIQVPSNILLLDQFIDSDIDGLLFDTPTFIKLLFGIDTELAHFKTDKFISNPATQKTIEKVQTVASTRRIPLYIRNDNHIEKYESRKTESSKETKEIKLHNMYISA